MFKHSLVYLFMGLPMNHVIRAALYLLLHYIDIHFSVEISNYVISVPILALPAYDALLIPT